MKYSYKSISSHSLKVVLIRHLPKLAFIVVLTLLIKMYGTNVNSKLENWDIFFIVFIPLISFLFFLNEDFIEEIIFNTNIKKVEIIYYNVYQKQMTKIWDFEEFFGMVKTSHKKQVLKIDFYRDKNLGFTLKKRKDNFSQENLNEINDLLLELNLVKTK